MIQTRTMSMRMAAAAGSLALAASVFTAPVAFAGDTPEETITEFAAAIEALDIMAMPTFMCAEQIDNMGLFDMDELTAGMPPGVDIETMLAAFQIDFDIDSMERVSESDSGVVIALKGNMTMDINPDELGPFVAALLEATGQEVTDDMVDLMIGMMASEFEPEETEVDTEVVLVPGETMAWVICSDLSEAMDGASDDMSDDMSEDEMAEDSMAEDEMAEDEMEEGDGE